MIQLPYGIADFYRIRQEGRLYVDRTAHIRDLERLGDILVFLRPRRFGKSLWLQTLANYYDLRRADDFDMLFGALAIGREPTPLRNRYFVLQWNFSSVTASGSVREIGESLHEHVSTQAKVFARQYKEILQGPIEAEGTPDRVLSSLLSLVSETPYKLYLLIDEYDNFVNEVMAKDAATYRALFENDGPFKELFKRVKSATEGEGLERVFATGVSPVALNDLTSGFNVSTDVSHKSTLATLCGFRETEVEDLLGQIAADQELSPDLVDSALGTLRTWYNGYQFTEEKGALVYNPTSTLYFLNNLNLEGKPPTKLHDQNLRTDRGKLAFLARSAVGAGVIEQLTEKDGEIEVDLVESFSLAELTDQLERDTDTVASMLYYMGLLTRTDVPFRLRIPNLVVRKLFLDRLLELYLSKPGDTSESRKVARRFFQDGELPPLLGFFENKLLPLLSTRDAGAAPKKTEQGSQSEPGGSGVNEMVIKAFFLSILFADDYYKISSESELEKEFADLSLLVRPEARRYGFFDFLFEFKLVRRKLLGKKGRELREMDEAELRQLPAVKEAFSEAQAQARRYRAALMKREGPLNLRTYAVVGVGLERMLGEEIDDP
jgi:hypothetical protein